MKKWVLPWVYKRPGQTLELLTKLTNSSAGQVFTLTAFRQTVIVEMLKWLNAAFNYNTIHINYSLAKI